MLDVEQPVSHAQLYQSLGRVEGKIDMLLQQGIEDRIEVEKLEVRVSSLEKGRAYILGAAAIVSAIGAFLFDYIKPHT